MSFEDTNVINFQEKKWEKEFDSDMQKAFNEVVEVLCTHLTPEVGVTVGRALAITMKDVSEKILERMNELEKPENTKDGVPFS